jgi:HSP20 family protein
MMQLTRNRVDGRSWHPFQLFDELGLAPLAEAEFAPTLEVTETESEWRVDAELPGVDPKDVSITVTGNVLTLRGEKKVEERTEAGSVRRAERRYGKFTRSLEFPSDLDGAKVVAKAKNGILTIRLPKAEAARPKAIDIQVE